MRDFGVTGVLGGVAVGGVYGLITGVIYAKTRTPSFVATLGMMTIARGVLLIVSGGMTMLIKDSSLRAFSGGA